MKKTSSPSQSVLVARDLRPDAKKRITLGKVLDELGHDVRFDVYRNDRGQIILDPQVSIPASEAWLFRNPDALAAVRRGLEEAGAGKARKAGSFARYATKA